MSYRKPNVEDLVALLVAMVGATVLWLVLVEPWLMAGWAK